MAAAALAGCSPGECAPIGTPSGAFIDTEPVVRAANGPLRVRACLHTTCVSRTLRAGQNAFMIHLTRPELDSSAPVRVRLRVRPVGHDELLIHASRLVRPERVTTEPPYCPTTAYQARLRLTRDGELVARR